MNQSVSSESSVWVRYVGAFVSFLPSCNDPLYLTWKKYVSAAAVRVTTSAYTQTPLSTLE